MLLESIWQELLSFLHKPPQRTEPNGTEWAVLVDRFQPNATNASNACNRS